jgi:hypothetical protein
LATASGTIENADLALPQAVVGLAATLTELLAQGPPAAPGLSWVGNYPNPFNPSTTLRFAVRDDLVARGGALHVEVLDARGRRVRTLSPVPVAPEISASWDGLDAGGHPASTGRYYVRASLGRELGRGSILLVK